MPDAPGMQSLDIYDVPITTISGHLESCAGLEKLLMQECEIVCLVFPYSRRYFYPREQQYG